MRKIRNLLATAAAVLLTAPVFAAPAVPKMDQSMWDEACTWASVMYGYSCEGLERPGVLYSEMRSIRGGSRTYGLFYRGSKYVVINVKTLKQKVSTPSLGVVTQADLTIYHEALHYISTNNDRGIARCFSEEISRRGTDSYAGRPYDPAWETWYNCR